MASRLKGLRIDPSDLALEVVSIVIAILLATIVGSIVDGYRSSARTRQAMARVCQEIERDDLEIAAPDRLHEAVRVSLVAAVGRARDERLSADAFAKAFASAAPRGFHPFGGTTTAWALAQSSGELASVPYDERSALQARYAEIENLDRLNVDVLHDVEAAPTEDRPNFYFIAASLESVFGDVIASEERLQTEDAAALAALRHAGDCPP